MKIGVLSVQGAVKEHMDALERALDEMDTDAGVMKVKSKEQLLDLDGLIIPGGESSTISRLIDKFDLRKKIIERSEEGMQIMGTCAGSILLAKEGDQAVDRSDTELLELMDMSVERNAFGRQKRSFESRLDINGIADDFPAVFIRAPAIVGCGAGCSTLAEIEDVIVAAEQDNHLALVFHPELTGDTRVHEYFLEKVKR